MSSFVSLDTLSWAFGVEGVMELALCSSPTFFGYTNFIPLVILETWSHIFESLFLIPQTSSIFFLFIRWGSYFLFATISSFTFNYRFLDWLFLTYTLIDPLWICGACNYYNFYYTCLWVSWHIKDGKVLELLQVILALNKIWEKEELPGFGEGSADGLTGCGTIFQWNWVTVNRCAVK